MGRHIDCIDADFQNLQNSTELYVDKTEIIALLNAQVSTFNKYICISRPRRFGKSLTASMLCTYYSKAIDSKDLFSKYKIAKDPSFTTHVNKYHTISLDINLEFVNAQKSVEQMISFITTKIVKDINKIFKGVSLSFPTILQECLSDVYEETKENFVIVIDEWDAILRDPDVSEKSVSKYLEWLNSILKGQRYVALAYMTGILPVKKYGLSAVNMFEEYTMLDPAFFAPFIGFTEKEVEDLCIKYDANISQMKRWYDGYAFDDNLHIYNPNSVVQALKRNEFNSFWSQTASFEILKNFIDLNIDELKSAIIKLIAGEEVYCNANSFSNDLSNIVSKDNALILLVHLGYLAVSARLNGRDYVVRIPNEEIRAEFTSAIKESNNYSYLSDLFKNSETLLNAIFNKDTIEVVKIFELNHHNYASIFTYNDENSLACVIAMSLLLSSHIYTFRREVVAGKGFADIIYEPKNNVNKPALVVELKYNKSAKTAIDQIKERQYHNYFSSYKGKVLLVGINYDRNSKKHSCEIEELTL